ncbi:hypothetical protein SGQ83_00300 [Flavobacterium sp. Fl-318]|uniref:Uncharacterized protein n=1 Tax=Flavobacterium cupriresistens TaxID=2893885 RepID=A0ABU4R5B1_9FLAO|nr:MULTISPECIES: hypothetical protein [unclassified Flavobacterium]MDX6187776.1 hypothetical protein [Flavobacterium sp. Fl-318]UFH42301.1 hypothetical protein LNP23_21150 [Flavobacterium sp. F-323]
MAGIILSRPKITNQSPVAQLRFEADGSKLVSEECQLTIEITFANGEEMDCAVRVSIDKTLHSYFTIDPNTVNSNKYEIYRYYGKVKSGKTDTFKFRLKSDKSIEDIKAFASPIIIIITVYNCKSNNLRKSESVNWAII